MINKLFHRFLKEEAGDLGQWITMIIIVVLSVILFTAVKDPAEVMITDLLGQSSTKLSTAMQ